MWTKERKKEETEKTYCWIKSSNSKNCSKETTDFAIENLSSDEVLCYAWECPLKT